MKMYKTDYRRLDFRKDSLYTIMHGLKASVDIIDEKLKLNDWYDGIFAREELEPVVGIAFITCQNYINKSIADLQPSYYNSLKKHQFYEKYKFLKNYPSTAIQLIVAIANYAKHEEEGDLKHHTTKVLDTFNLEYVNPDIVDSSPIFSALELIDENWNLIVLADLICDWREELWQSLEDNSNTEP
ncbi:MAG: hypothetical protein ABIP95_07075 [Pelobium sp.]